MQHQHEMQPSQPEIQQHEMQQQPEMQQLVEYILNPRQHGSVEWQLDVPTPPNPPISSPPANAIPAPTPAPAVNPELVILGQIRDIMQIVREWVETQKD